MRTELIAREDVLAVEQESAALSLLFAAGGRPTAEDVERALAAPSHSASGDTRAIARVTQARGEADGWIELLANGLTFELAGLQPGPGAEVSAAAHFFGLPAHVADEACEAIAIAPGPHLAGGGAMMPVVRTMASLASVLAARLGARTVCWAPARSWMDPGYFTRIVDGWLAGGAFPALGFTGIARTGDGGVESDGLAYFTGQELQVDARRGESAADTVKLAVRAIDHMVRHGPVERREKLTGPSGEALIAEPAAGGRIVRLWRES